MEKESTGNSSPSVGCNSPSKYSKLVGESPLANLEKLLPRIMSKRPSMKVPSEKDTLNKQEENS